MLRSLCKAKKMGWLENPHGQLEICWAKSFLGLDFPCRQHPAPREKSPVRPNIRSATAEFSFTNAHVCPNQQRPNGGTQSRIIVFGTFDELVRCFVGPRPRP